MPSRDFKGDGADPEPDGDVDQDDFAFMESCFTGPDVAVGTGTDCGKADLDRDGDVDAADYALFQICMSGPGQPAPAECISSAPPPGTFLLHGLAVEAIPDGPTLLYARARYYDTRHGRWLQRDPKGYVDGPNLYEAFGGNPLRHVDPMGEDIFTWAMMGWDEFGKGTEVSSWEMFKAWAVGYAQGRERGKQLVARGAAKAGRELVLIPTDIVCLSVDSTSGFVFETSLRYQPRSMAGQYFDSLSCSPRKLKQAQDEFFWDAQKNAWTLGLYHTGKGTVELIQTGDFDKFAEEVGGPNLLLVVTYGAGKTGQVMVARLKHTGTIGETPLNAPKLHLDLKNSALTKGQPPGPVVLKYVLTSGAVLESTAGRTTTIIGSYRLDMRYVLRELGDAKTLDFGPKPGRFNVLNVPDEFYLNPIQFWDEFNLPWLEAAVLRGDRILFATEPTWGASSSLKLWNAETGKWGLSGFGREYLNLRRHGFGYDAVQHQAVPQGGGH